MARGDYLIRAFCENPWAIQKDKLHAILEVVERHAHQVRLDDQAPKWLSMTHPCAEKIFAQQHMAGEVDPSGQSVLVLPVRGTITHRANLVNSFSGGTSTEKLTEWLREGVADDTVSEIVLDIDSPGGAVFGVQELAEELRDARDRKRITAVANDLAASAAYWIASQASEVVVTPSGEVGSIGVFAIHRDFSEMDKKDGVKTTFISAGKFKTEGNRYEPLTDEAKDFIQSRVDEYRDAFVDAVAAGRGVSTKTVRNGFGEGRALGSPAALAEGMVDRISTLDTVLGEAVSRIKQSQQGKRTRAALALRARSIEVSELLAARPKGV